MLRALLKHIQMISIISRSARIEAASLDSNRGSFLDFTQEAFQLAKAAQDSVESCTRDQVQLADAIKTALDKHREFQTRYREQLISVSSELIASHGRIQQQQSNGVRLTETTGASAGRIAQAVGISIVSLQAGDSIRQRLEHVCHGLHVASGYATGIVPDDAEDAALISRFIAGLEAEQLDDAVRQFDTDIRQIAHTLSSLGSDVAGIVSQGKSLYGNQNNTTSSFLSEIKQSLNHASELIRSCENARISVDRALSVVEDTLGKFRRAASELSHTVTDIILIGMNAGLRAGHLGAKGSSFVVIANELKTTADHISGGAGMLRPVLDEIEVSANDLRSLRVDAESSQLAGLENSVLAAIQDIEMGNERVNGTMTRLIKEGAEFEDVIASAQDTLKSLADALAVLPDHISSLRADSKTFDTMPAAAGEKAKPLLEDLANRYTMATEREIHRRFLNDAGIKADAIPDKPATETAADDVLFF
ncbi:chemotaxis protein [Bradyrhizobium canariense]|uniref:chemotaxis protein n=1 Tax=Bradyrhizobium canariense TaxID=255045 RepID=UPI0011BA4DA7|nr:chemotaxis protein [Bradyrhizobium canariense]